MPSSGSGTRAWRAALLTGVLVALGLVLLAWLLVPAINPVSVAGACAVLAAYGLAFYFGAARLGPDVLRWARLFGLMAGAVFATEILLEYALLPSDNTRWGIVEFSLVFALYFLSSAWAAYRSHALGAGILTAVMSALFSSLIWLIALLAVFLVFRGTARQTQVFLAEGSYQDFTRSGMASFNTFIVEDLLGAAFFHLLLGPAVAAILGVIGGAIAKLVVRLTKANN